MKVFCLIDENNNKKLYNLFDRVDDLIKAIQKEQIKTIVVGEINNNKEIVWEKQFLEADVLPPNFGT